MDVQDAIRQRRAYRSLESTEIAGTIPRDLAELASLAPSCFNHQPWRYVFVYDRTVLKELHGALSKGNEWGRAASMIIAVYSSKDYDCEVQGRQYYLFDVGLSVGFLVLRATELGLVAHPIAGYDEEKAKKALGIGEDMELITLVIVGRHSASMSGLLSEKQAEAELTRPARRSLDEVARFVG
jgi:nitroreductase